MTGIDSACFDYGADEQRTPGVIHLSSAGEGNQFRSSHRGAPVEYSAAVHWTAITLRARCRGFGDVAGGGGPAGGVGDGHAEQVAQGADVSAGGFDFLRRR
jgi:hypothetical protein